MHPSLIRIIFLKDLKDAIRDARVLVAIVVPLGLGIFYNTVFDDEDGGAALLETTVAYAESEPSALPELLREQAEGAIRIAFLPHADEAAVRAAVASEEAAVGLVFGERFDARVRAGESPPLAVVTGTETDVAVRFVVTALEPALRRLAGQAFPATIQTGVAAPLEDEPAVFDVVGLRRYSILATVMFLIAMVAMLAVPVILAEETEKKTLDALVLIASHADVIAAKALVGLAYVVATVGLQLGLTGLWPEDPVVFGAAVLTLGVTLIGFGLLLGSLFRNANQLNTWSGFLLMPVIAPVFLVGLPVPDRVEAVLSALPTSQATRLALNGLSGQALFADPWLSFGVVIAWGVVAYLLLLSLLQRRQA